MATLSALVLSGGRTQNIQAGDSLRVGDGIIGAGVGALSIGTLGQLTTILGDFRVDGAETIIGGSTFQGDATFDGNVTFGNAPTDTVTFVSRVATNLNFIKEVNHIVAVDASTTAATAGGSLTITSGNGNGAAGGALAIDAGSGTVGGALTLGTTNAASVGIGRAGITTTITGGLSQLTGAVSLTANAASSFTVSVGALTIDAATALNLGDTTATSVSIGRTGQTATFNGAVSIPASAANLLTINAIAYRFPAAQAAGQVLTTDGAGVLTWSAAAAGTVTGTGVANRIAFWTSASDISNSANFLFDPAGATALTPPTTLTLTGGTGAALTTTAGALTITSAAAAVWSTSAGNLTLSAASTLNLGTAGNGTVVIGQTGQNATFGGRTILQGTVADNLTIRALAYVFPAALGAAGAVLTDAAGTGTLTWAAPAAVSQLAISGQTTTGLADGDFGYVSSANTWSTARNDGTSTQATVIGVNEGVVSAMSLPGSVVENAKFTTGGGSPVVGTDVYLASAADDAGTGVGKLTATAPVLTGSFLVVVGVCVDASNYAALKTVKIIFNPASAILL